MKRNKKFNNYFLSVVVFCLSASVVKIPAQTGGTFDLSHAVVAGGGGSNSAGGAFQVDGTAGQGFAGTTSNSAAYDLHGGFWFQNQSVAPAPQISGTIFYGNPIGNPVPPRFVKNVSLASILGSPPVGPVVTGPSGTYALTGFGGGSYTIKPTKPGGPNIAITSNDAARVAQGVSGAVPFVSNNQRFAADTTGNGVVSSQDAAKIAQFVAGLPFSPPNFTGEWRFFTSNLPAFPAGTHPQERNYASVTSNVTGEDYIGILIGEVSGNWNPASHPRPVGVGQLAANSGPKRSIDVELPRIAASTDREFAIPVTVQRAADKEIISYEFNLRYDATVIQPRENVVDLTRTSSRGFKAVANPREPGLLKVVIYGHVPIDENGVLLNLRFLAVGKAGTVSPLRFERIAFNDGEQRIVLTDGQVTLF